MKPFPEILIIVFSFVLFGSIFAQGIPTESAALARYNDLVRREAELDRQMADLAKRIAEFQKNSTPAYVVVDPLSATVRIEVTSPGSIITGSAFILECAEDLNDDGTRNCLVATVAHAFRDAGITDATKDVASAQIKIQFSDKGKITNTSAPGIYIKGVLRHGVDMAYVVIKAPGSMVVPVVPLVSKNYNAVPNQPVIQFGYPNGASVAQVNRRTIMNTTASRYITCTGGSASGNSGGLLINAQGQAIGIASASVGNSECKFTSFGDMHGLARDPAVAPDLARYGLGSVFKK